MSVATNCKPLMAGSFDHVPSLGAGGWLSHNMPYIKVVIYSFHGPVAQASNVHSDLEETFKRAVELASSLEGGKWNLSLRQKGTLYACYKQVYLGDCTGKRPSVTSLYARQKYDAWMCAKGASKEDAMKKYIETVAIFAPEFLSY